MFLLDFKKKVKIKINNQMIARIIAIVVIFIGLNIWFVLDYMSYHYADIIFDNTAFYYIVLIMISYFAYIVVWIANLIVKPLDKFLSKTRR